MRSCTRAYTRRHSACIHSPLAAPLQHAEGDEAQLELELTVREHPQGRVSTFLNRRARPGLVLGLSQADGDFALPDRDRPPALVLISGGTGITPVMSMLRTLCDEHHTGPVTFLHYARSAAHVPYAAELERLAAANPNVTLARFYDDPGVPGELTGLFSGDHLDAVAPRHAQAQTFVCGPPPLMDAVGELHARRGLEHALHVERFVPPPATLVLGDAEGDIAFAATGTTVANDGATLLEQAERAGLRPDSGCRMGICHTCTWRKVAGAVRDVTRELGDFASDVFEMREAARRAEADAVQREAGPPPLP